MTHEELRKHRCMMCDRIGEGFMLTNTVWQSLNVPVRTVLCISCTRDRLGRDFVIEDFTNAPINELLFVGYEIQKT